MSAVTLIELTPRRPADGVTETVRLCHNAVARANFLGVQWRPSAARLPSFESSLGFDGANFGRGTTPVVGDMEITLEENTRAWAGLIWKGAGITLRRAAWTRAGDDPADGDFQTIWQGRVDSGTVTDATLRLIMLDPGAQLRRPMVTRQFGTSGISVLDAAPAAPQRGNLVPMGWGRLESVPAILIDPADLIYLLVGQPADGVQGFYDGGAAFTAGVSRGSLAALRATSPAAGAVDYCLNADGLTLARPWTKPVYPFTADLTVGDARSAEVAVALVSSRTTIGFRAGTVAAYNALQGADIGLYVAEQVSIAECLDRIFAPLGSFWRLRSDGTIDLRRIDPAAAPARSFGSWQRERPERRGVVMPTRRRTLGYKPNWRVHGEGEIARALLVTAGEVTYADGTPVEALKPAVPAATRNEEAGNLIVSPLQLLNFSSTEGVIRRTPPGHAGATAPFMVVHDAGATGLGYLDSVTGFPVRPGDKISVAARYFQTGLPSGSTLRLKAEFLNSAGAYMPGIDIFLALRTVGVNFPAGAVIEVRDSFTTPAGAAACRLSTNPNNSFGPIGYSAVERPWAGPHEIGATEGAPAGTAVAGVAAPTLVADTATAKADAAAALSTLSFIADDSYLSRDEKPEVRKQRDIIIAEYAELYPRASTYSTGDVPSQTAYATAYGNLIAYLDVLALSSATDTFIVRSVFNFRFVDYYSQRDAVLAEISNILSGQTQLLDAGNGRAVTRRLLPQIINSGVIQVVGNAILTSTTDGSGVATIAIDAHPILDDAGTVSFTASSIGGLAASTDYYVYEINPNYIGGARSYSATTDRNELATPGARFVGFIRTAAAGGSSAGSGAGAGFQTPGNPEWEP